MLVFYGQDNRSLPAAVIAGNGAGHGERFWRILQNLFSFGITQTAAAERFGITQQAVSKAMNTTEGFDSNQEVVKVPPHLTSKESQADFRKLTPAGQDRVRQGEPRVLP